MAKDIAEILKEAAKAVEDADLPEDLRASAFEKAFDFASGGLQPAQHQQPPAPEDVEVVEHPEWVTTLSNKLGIDPDLVTQVYSNNDGEFGIDIPHQWLGDSNKDGMLDLSRIVAAGRQALEIEDVTSTKDIRPILDEYGVRDKNYSKYVDELKDQFVVKQDGKNKTLKASKPTMTAVGKRIVELTGGGE